MIIFLFFMPVTTLRATAALSNARTIYQSSAHDLGCIMMDTTFSSLESTGYFYDNSNWSFSMISPFAKIKSSFFEFLKMAGNSKKHRDNTDLFEDKNGPKGILLNQKNKGKVETQSTLIIRVSSHSMKSRSSRYFA
jgi:hypothetical protein